ncbi:hypothetical protein ACFZAE_18640 [Streptomyces scabiei]|nr:hypothetical protein [Streptomyces sp. ATCC 21386]
MPARERPRIRAPPQGLHVRAFACGHRPQTLDRRPSAADHRPSATDH